MEEKVVSLPTGDKRAEVIYQELMDFLEPRAVGLPIFTVLGIVELLRATIIRSCMIEMQNNG